MTAGGSAKPPGGDAMKIRDLKPCDNCGKPIGIIFYIVRSTIAVVKQESIREYVGLSLMLGSGLLAETMGGHQDSVVDLLADQKDENGKPLGWREAFLCGDCHGSDLNIAALAEKVLDREATTT